MKRRQFLRAGAASTSIFAVEGVVGSQPEGIEDVIATAIKIRQRDGEKAMEEYLETTGTSLKSTTYQLPISFQKEEYRDKPIIQEIETGAIDIKMGMWKNGTTHAATMDIYYDLELDRKVAGFPLPIPCSTNKVSYGENPLDAAAMTWGTDRWHATSTSRFEASITEGEAQVSDPFQGHWLNKSTGKIGFRIDDLAVSKDWKDPDLFDGDVCLDASKNVYAGTVGVKLEPVGDFDPSERYVQGGYSHAYNASSPKVGASLGIPPSAGVTISPAGRSIKQDSVIKDKYGTEIQVTQRYVIEDPCDDSEICVTSE